MKDVKRYKTSLRAEPNSARIDTRTRTKDLMIQLLITIVGAILPPIVNAVLPSIIKAIMQYGFVN